MLVATITELRNTCTLTVKPRDNALGGKDVASNWVNYNLSKNKIRITLLQEEYLLSKKVMS